MKKLIISIILSSLISTIAVGQTKDIKPSFQTNNSNLLLTNMYINKMSTSNEVFDVIIKEYIKNFDKRQSALIKNISDFNTKEDKKLERIKKEINDATNEGAKQSAKSSAKYTFEKSLKDRLNYQEEEINKSFTNESEIFVNIFKNTMKEYTITKEEKDFLAENIKAVVNQLKNIKIGDIRSQNNKKLNQYSNYDIEIVLNDMRDINEGYQTFTSSFNRKIDKALSNVVWKSMRSKITIPEV